MSTPKILPYRVQFFIEQSDVVGLTSFQLQADTGCGEVRGRPDCISLESVRNQISLGGRF